ncbi:MAG: 5'-methylthioadenosine/S-adenosylhomocysteine nucleosidase [Syntrophobacterales bacterium]|nr:MAG: 5'-methylthioadenosine/S-adenosylhomocysteine nucleosidase [Syntrophobacterales bacterium]
MSQIHRLRSDSPIGIIGATEIEIGLLKKRFELIKKERVGNARFFRGYFSGKELILVESGIGYAHAANACIHMIERFSPAAIFSFGLAGSVDKNTKIGDILLTTHLLWVEDMEMLKVKKTYILDENIVNIISNILDKYNLNFKMGKVLTVPYFIFKLDERCRIGRELSVKAVEMEGAAIAGEATNHRIPLMALRMISDDMSTREIDYGMVVESLGKPTLKAGLRFSLAHRRDFLEVFRFGRQVRRLGRRLSEIGARIVEEIIPLPMDSIQEMDFHVQQ